MPVISLPDGRALAYEEWGDSAGIPVVFFHGTPGSRMFRLDDDAVRSTGTRLVTVDRPGYGRSDPKPDRAILDWPADVAALADALALSTFGLIGGSGGGAYALACGHEIPDRLASLTLMCPVGPLVEGRAVSPDVATDGAARTFERYRTDPEAWLDDGSSEPDQRWQADPVVRAMLLENFAEAFRQGHEPLGYESFLLFAQPWGFQPEDVRVPASTWVGDQDRLRGASERYAQRMPSCELHLFEGEGHLIGPPCHAAILRAATAWAR